MKLVDIFEMTQRLGYSLNSMPFPEFSKYQLKLEGKMQHGYEVYSFKYENTMIYGVKVGDEFASFVQLRPITIPGLNNVVESLNSKTKPEFSGQLLSYKLRYFLAYHLGVSILLGNMHSIETENVLPKITRMFAMRMCNIKTGELQDWSTETYQQLTHHEHPTDWQVLLSGSPRPAVNEDCHIMDWSGDKGRHLWTYFNFFNEFEGE
jgi:hypothetical protein